MTLRPAGRARAMVESAARRPPYARAFQRRASTDHRRALRSRLMLHEIVDRQARGRRSTGRRRGLCATGLLVLLLLAIFPTHANGLATGRRSARLRHGLCAIGLPILLLLAAIPARANGLAPVTPAHPVPDHRALDEGGDVGSTAASLVMFADRSEERAHGAPSGPADTRPAIPAVSAPPTTGWYRLAAAEQNISAEVLRALHEVETNAAPDGCVANAQGSGAVGPFQFKPATFRQYGVDANHDGYSDICSFTDALFSAARYLRALGAGGIDDASTRAALARYGTDPDRVLALAISYRERAALAD